MTLQLPRFQQSAPLVNDNGYPNVTFHIWWDKVAGNLETTFNDLQQQVTDLAAVVQTLSDMNSDNVLTPVEKPIWITLNTQITGEQSDIDTKATAFGITTEKTNYDNAVSALSTHLAGLTTPVAWNNLTGNTTITGTTFRSKFNDVLSTKQLLLSAIDAKAKTLADTAQTSANTADADAIAAARESARIASYTSPGSGIISASDVGTDCDIVISNHTRVYPVQGSVDVPDVSITGATLHGKAFSTRYYIYYDDTTLADTTPSFLASTTDADAQVGKAAGRHFVGFIDTPADGGAPTSGSGGAPPGGGGGGSRGDLLN